MLANWNLNKNMKEIKIYKKMRNNGLVTLGAQVYWQQVVPTYTDAPGSIITSAHHKCHP